MLSARTPAGAAGERATSASSTSATDRRLADKISRGEAGFNTSEPYPRTVDPARARNHRKDVAAPWALGGQAYDVVLGLSAGSA